MVKRGKGVVPLKLSFVFVYVNWEVWVADRETAFD